MTFTAVPQMKSIYHMKLKHQDAIRLVECLLKNMESLTDREAFAIFSYAMGSMRWVLRRPILQLYATIGEIKNFVPPYAREITNDAGKTPSLIFTEQHKELKKEGEKWMRNTTTSCILVAALIVTVVFAAAITVPGDNDQSNGVPIWSKQTAFIIFSISDAISLFTSTTSLLLFLSLWTSRYAEEDFLSVLPKRLIMGLLTLFLSITFMMVAFSATVYLVFGQRRAWVLIPVSALACFPITSYVLLQFPLLVDVISSTYGPGIFGRGLNKHDHMLKLEAERAAAEGAHEGNAEVGLFVKETSRFCSTLQPMDKNTFVDLTVCRKLDFHFDEAEKGKKELLDNGSGEKLITECQSTLLQEKNPKIGMEFDSEKTAYNFYNEYAKLAGFGIRKRNVHRGIDKRDVNVKSHRPETRTGCEAMLKIDGRKKSGKYKVVNFIADHNDHDLLQFKHKGLFPPRALRPLDPSSRRNVILALTVKGGVMCITTPDRHHRKGSHGNS
ncbi:hypothetical protein BUALT_Bualt16G0044200 [Buddleja alternifolia]|uniref:Uncharacterized protein n=1 Tax=Buddleja alternifolia TaxID=168488 RepID=A0AAV6WJM6_9LAMI|nr:hypothetical protein BUALT_Bualt16G0044200 [Buddleja alternifolia]